MLKLSILFISIPPPKPAAFGRLCVETFICTAPAMIWLTQPPSGGCVLKPFFKISVVSPVGPAAFGRLCVETLKPTTV